MEFPGIWIKSYISPESAGVSESFAYFYDKNFDCTQKQFGLGKFMDGLPKMNGMQILLSHDYSAEYDKINIVINN